MGLITKIVKDGEPQGAVYYRALALVDGWFEIYGIDMAQEAYHPELFKKLLNAALSDAKRRNGRFMTFCLIQFVEESCVVVIIYCDGIKIR